LQKTRTVIKPPSALSLRFKEFWEYRELLYFFTWRDIKVRYKQTFFGVLWALLQPLGLMLLFVLVFSKTSIGQSSNGIPYGIFVLSGLILWNLFHASVSHASDGMITNASIIKKIYFPKLLIPLSSIGGSLLDFFISFFIFFIFCAVYDQPLHMRALLFFPAGIILCLITSFGLGTLLGALNVKYRDFRYALPFLLQFLFFATQVIYPAGIVNNRWLHYVMAINPMNAVLELFRAGLTTAPLNAELVLTGTAAGIIIAVCGFIYFNKTEVYFADIV
jgi:lipopolysaccharide transport system permease protein